MIAANIMTSGSMLPQGAALLDAVPLVDGAGAAAVVASDGKVLGLVTPGLILERVSGGNADLASVPVQESMDENFAVVAPEADFKAVSLALDGGGGRVAVVVVDDGGRFLGLITPKDMQRRVWEYAEKIKAGKA